MPPTKKIDIGDYYADDRLIRETLGWQPKVPLTDGLRRTLEFYRTRLGQYVDMSVTSAILQCNPGAGYLERKEEIDTAMRRVMESGRYILGSEVRQFEQEFADYLGAQDAVAVANGTDALEFALRALGIGPGDSVATVSHTAVATVAAIERCGARAVLVDVAPDSCLMSPQSLEDVIRNPPRGHRLRAVVPVHLYGQPAEMDAIVGIAAQFGVPVVEDCAQSHGARLHGRQTGTFGVLAAFSFYPTKNLGAFGDGGMIVASTAELGDRLRALRQYGWRDRYISSEPGVNSRLDELQAAILRVQLRYLDQDNRRRQQLADRYTEWLSPLPLEISTPALGVEHVYHQYVVKCDRRDAFRAVPAAMWNRHGNSLSQARALATGLPRPRGSGWRPFVHRAFMRTNC